MALNTFPMVCDENFSYFQRFLRPIRDDYDEKMRDAQIDTNAFCRINDLFHFNFSISLILIWVFVLLNYRQSLWFKFGNICLSISTQRKFKFRCAFHIEWSDNSIAKTFTCNIINCAYWILVICSGVRNQMVWICFIIHFLSSLFIVHVFFFLFFLMTKTDIRVRRTYAEPRRVKTKQKNARYLNWIN